MTQRVLRCKGHLLNITGCLVVSLRIKFVVISAMQWLFQASKKVSSRWLLLWGLLRSPEVIRGPNRGCTNVAPSVLRRLTTVEAGGLEQSSLRSTLNTGQKVPYDVKKSVQVRENAVAVVCSAWTGRLGRRGAQQSVLSGCTNSSLRWPEPGDPSPVARARRPEPPHSSPGQRRELSLPSSVSVQTFLL